jgi:hypothetical protein
LTSSPIAIIATVIDTVSRAEKMDRTVSDLGRRIRERDLLKLVPCSSHQVREFLTMPEAFERVYEAIGPYCPGDPRYYLYVDKYSFTMLSR